MRARCFITTGSGVERGEVEIEEDDEPMTLALVAYGSSREQVRERLLRMAQQLAPHLHEIAQEAIETTEEQ